MALNLEFDFDSIVCMGKENRWGRILGFPSSLGLQAENPFASAGSSEASAFNGSWIVLVMGLLRDLFA